ncbi:hypothetical protein [Streptomyces sp. NPDC002057]|uniref:hypothetical protein n=1 Tax=Streptomyces sp. NPDC002057 TaxID=3154664 RepID=UPI00331FF1E5
MTRRMQANLGRVNSYHREEHDEGDMCQCHPPCRPVERKPVTNLAEAVNAVPRITGHPYMDIVRKAYVLDALKGTVAVPDTGTYVVADGVVHKADNWGKAPLRGGGTCWTVSVLPPKPTFFEEGKTYSRKVSWSIRAQMADVTERVIVKRVEKNGNGAPVAFVRVFAGAENADPTVDEWTTLRQYDWDNGGWEEWPS